MNCFIMVFVVDLSSFSQGLFQFMTSFLYYTVSDILLDYRRNKDVFNATIFFRYLEF